MIVVRLRGGLGNQLFQYCAGRAAASRWNAPIKLDLYSFPDHLGRDYELGVYSIQAAGTATWEDRKALCYLPPTLLARLKRKLLGGQPVYRHASTYIQRLEGICAYYPEIFELGPDLYLDGYWQSWKYFAGIADTIRFELSRPEQVGSAALALADRITANEQAVSVHVRRGDYANDAKTTAFHGLCTIEYYQQAVDQIRSTVPGAHFFIFSDEPDWVEENLLLDGPTTLVPPGHTGPEDLWLMSQCRHQIIANSSFSWWGAWLNPNPDKLVIAPKRWFADESVDTTDLIPPEWDRI